MLVRFRRSTRAMWLCLIASSGVACATVTQEDPPSNQTGAQGGGGGAGLGGASQGGSANGGSSPGVGGSSPSSGGSMTVGNGGGVSNNGGTGGASQGGTGGSVGQGGTSNPSLTFDGGRPPGTVLLEDSFENGLGLWTAPNGSWDLETDPGASGNVYSQSDSDATALAAVDGAFTDYVAQVDFKVVAFGGQSSDNMAGLCVRVADASNFYMIGQRSNNGNYIQLRRFGDDATILADDSDFDQPVNTWYRLVVQVNGPNITAYLNDRLMFTQSDSTLTGGGIALCSEEASVMFDNFIVTDGN
jgi:hypothetical protein